MCPRFHRVFPPEIASETPEICEKEIERLIWQQSEIVQNVQENQDESVKSVLSEFYCFSFSCVLRVSWAEDSSSTKFIVNKLLGFSFAMAGHQMIGIIINAFDYWLLLPAYINGKRAARMKTAPRRQI
jgi:hypothetical protein